MKRPEFLDWETDRLIGGLRMAMWYVFILGIIHGFVAGLIIGLVF